MMDTATFSQALLGTVQAVSLNPAHGFSKQNQDRIRVLKGLGVEGDAHMGETVQHLSRIAQNPLQPNLRQVHLIASELFEMLSEKGYQLSAGDLGENILTTGLDLISLPVGTKLHIGESAVVELTGLRNPCKQIDDFQEGLMGELVFKDADGNIVRQAGVMSVVETSGEVSPQDTIRIELPPEPHQKMERI
ncbi:MOSC domain-containing protein [Magnetovibrio sp. PR-2]|uniref:MOSC domain-containing protein n=1 Tax=Magnetovibrio sp. PR-2 TaxID=3120356 RepID=UPI002FCE1BB5